MRELIPAAGMATPLQPGMRIGVFTARLGSLPPPPELQSGPGTWLPEPLTGLADSVPFLSVLVPDADAPWMPPLRRQDLLSPALAEAILGTAAVPLTSEKSRFMWSEEAELMARARAQKLDALLIIHASVGPDDDGKPLPHRLAVAADVTLLDVWRGETLCRGYDRISVRLEGQGEAALPRSLRRAGRQIGQRLRASLKMGAGVEADPDDEEP